MTRRALIVPGLAALLAGAATAEDVKFDVSGFIDGSVFNDEQNTSGFADRDQDGIDALVKRKVILRGSYLTEGGWELGTQGKIRLQSGARSDSTTGRDDWVVVEGLSLGGKRPRPARDRQSVPGRCRRPAPDRPAQCHQVAPHRRSADDASGRARLLPPGRPDAAHRPLCVRSERQDRLQVAAPLRSPARHLLHAGVLDQSRTLREDLAARFRPAVGTSGKPAPQA